MLRRALALAASLVVAALVWLGALALLYGPAAADLPAQDGASPRALALAARQVRLWSEPARLDAVLEGMRGTNPEWDFMGRTFLAMALCELSLRDPPGATERLAVVDRIVDATLQAERTRGQAHFLLPYGRSSPFRGPGGRSLFVDGEVALMLGARELVAPRPERRDELRRRRAAIVASMEAGPVLSGESYPDECWTFCNTAALAALRLGDAVEGTSDGADLARRWVAKARARLVDPGTGLLVSSYHLDGSPRDGPEGSSIWFAIHALDVVDPAFAREQYAAARRELACTAGGFGWAREWPASWTGPRDVDSGPVVPVLEASPGSSGLALLGAAAADDREYLAALLRSLDLAAFPVREGEGLRYAASNAVGDAGLLWALVRGPMWARARERAPW